MKKSVKLLAIALAIIISFGALPVAVFAANEVVSTNAISDETAPVAGDDNVLYAEDNYLLGEAYEPIKIDYVTEPWAYEEMWYDFGVDEEAPYEMYDEDYYYHSAWVESDTAPADYEELLSNGEWYHNATKLIAMPSKYYTFVAFVYAKESFEFSAEMPATVNGSPANLELTKDGEAAVWCTYDSTVTAFPCTISFDANGAEGEMPDEQTDKFGKYILPVCTFTAPDGMVFDKWRIITSYSEGDFEFEGVPKIFTEDIILQAHWKEITDDEELDTLVLKNGKTYKNRIASEELTNMGITGESDGKGGYCYTFNGVNYSTDAAVAMVILDEDATIQLAPNSENTVSGGSGNENDSDSYGISAYGNLTFIGSGALNVTAGVTEYRNIGLNVVNNLVMNGGVITASSKTSENDSLGIYVDNGDFTINAGMVIGNGGNIAGEYPYRSQGIEVDVGDLIVNGGSVIGNGGTASGVDVYSRGIFIDDGDLIVNDGSVTGNAGAVSGECSINYGIEVDDGDLIVNGGSVIGNSDTVSGEEANSRGIYVDDGDLIVNGGSVTGNAGAISGEYSGNYGLYVGDGSLTVNGGSVEGNCGSVSANEYGFSAGIIVCSGITVLDGTVTGNGGDSPSNSEGIHVVYGDSEVHGGVVTGTSGAVLNENVYCAGIGLFIECGSLSVTGGTVTGTGGSAEGYSAGMFVNNDLTVSGGEVIGIGGEAIVAEDSIDDAFSEGFSVGVSFIMSGGIVSGTGGNSENSFGMDYYDSASAYMTGGKATFIGNSSAMFWNEYVQTIITNEAETEIEVTAGIEPNGSDASKLADWKGDGSDIIDSYKYMSFWNGIKALMGIEIIDEPTTKLYSYNSSTSTAGLKVIARYSDGSYVDVTNQVEVKNFDASEIGNRTATVEFEGKKATFSYTVTEYVAPTLVSIRIEAAPKNTQYRYKSSVSKDGLKVIAVYSDNSEVDITNQAAVKDFDTAKAGSRTATVEFEGKTATFEYSVKYAWWQMIIRIILLGFLWY